MTAAAVAASLPSDCPAGLAEALAERDAPVAWQRREGPRMYVRAETADGASLFGWYTHSRHEGAMVAREALIRDHVGTTGVLRAPPLLAHGENWRLEPFIRSAPLEGPEAIGIAVAAAARIAELELPDGPAATAEPRRVALVRRARVMASPLPTRELIAARRLLEGSPLPLRTSHGEFHPAHLLLADGALHVIDWDLAGRRPYGYDLMQLWVMLEDAEDRAMLFAAAAELVGRERTGDLARLRHGILTRMIAACYSERYAVNRDPALGRRLLSLLPETRRALRAGA